MFWSFIENLYGYIVSLVGFFLGGLNDMLTIKLVS